MRSRGRCKLYTMITVDPQQLAQIRQIRSQADMSLKPSPFLRPSFVDDGGEELPIKLRNYQKSGIMNLLVSPRMILGDDTGLGKAQPVYAKVLTPVGWRAIGDLQVGDAVMGADGRPTKVIGVYPQGRKQLFRVTMSDGSSTECCDEHLWTVRTGNTRRSGDGWRTFSLKHIMSLGLKRQRNSTGLRWSIPVVEPIQFRAKQLPVDPYLLGVLLGDGSMPGTVAISNGDPELFELVGTKLPQDCKFGKPKADGLTVSLVGRPGVRNSLASGLIELGLMHKNWANKFIPRQYLMASVEQRVQLLRGLMDTDGFVSKDGKITQFYSSNLTLVHDFVHLVRSLGGVAKVKSKTPILSGKSKAKRGRLAYTVTISLPNDVVPFALPRKVARWVPRTKYFPARRISKIEPVPAAQCRCIRVAARDSLYVTDDFIVTHNTLEVLSAIGYVWLKEPEYVPIVLTKKSSLYQWAAETRKFLKDMDAVTIDGNPYERDGAYSKFFESYGDGHKRLLIMTYDALLKDATESVVRKSDHKASPSDKKALAAARKTHKAAKQAAAAALPDFESYFNKRPFEIWDHAKTAVAIGAKPRPPLPNNWQPADESQVQALRQLIEAEQAWRVEVVRLEGIVHPTVVAPGILGHVRAFQAAHPQAKLMLVMDEAHVVKNYKGKIHLAAADLSKCCERVYGLTATPVKNRLMEFFALFRIVMPGLFPKVTWFQNEYCVTKMQRIGGGRQVPIVVGYKHLDKFVQDVEPFYLSRRKYDVAAELPRLVTRELRCELTDLQEELYDMAEAGLLEKDADPDESPAAVLGAMTFVQEAVDAPSLLNDSEGNPFQGSSPKIDTLLEMLEDELDGVKTIVFSRFERMISLTEQALKDKGIRCTRITGKEAKAADREKAKALFQDPRSGVNVILITEAGSESINLQAAEHFVLMDSPWSWGTYLQLIGRMIRIGSKHGMVVASHLVGVRKDGRKTIDHYVIKKLKTKKALADKVAGEGLKDGLEFVPQDDAMELVSMIKAGREGGPKPAALSVKAKAPAGGKSPKKTPPRAQEDPPGGKAAIVDLGDLEI